MIHFDKIARALPEKFSFYHLGEIEAETTSNPLDWEGLSAFGFSVHGDLDAVLLVAVEDVAIAGMESVYVEAGNLMASQLANALAAEDVDVMISPPMTVSASTLARMLVQGGSAKIEKLYWHRHAGQMIQIRTALIGVSHD